MYYSQAEIAEALAEDILIYGKPQNHIPSAEEFAPEDAEDLS